MIYALLGYAAVSLVGLLLLAWQLVKAKSGETAAHTAAGDEHDRAEAYRVERDALTVVNARQQDERADLLLRIAAVEAGRNAAEREVVELKVKLVATTPVGEEGAAVVNAGFSEPLLPGGKP